MLIGNSISAIICMIPAMLIALSVHECMHAYVAYKLGDRSQKYMGRMTLDPLAHIDILGFISIMLVGFGWGKPVIIDDSNFKNKSRDTMLSSLAGPLSNLCLAFIITIMLKLLMLFGLGEFFITFKIGGIILEILKNTILLNVVFAVFNMLPIPPFDGSKVLRHFLPYKGKKFLDNMEKYTFYIILILVITNITSYVISPVVGFILNIINNILML